MTRKRLFIVFLALILTVCFVVVMLRSVKINKITCANQNRNCSQKLRQEMDAINKTNIFETKREIENKLKENKNVSDYNIQFGLPLTFEVNVIEDSGMVAFVKPDGSFAIINGKGEITENVSETNLPKVISYRNLSQDQLMYIANLMNRIYNFFGNTSTKVLMDGIEVSNIKDKTVMFPISGDQDVLLGSLSLILSRLPSVKEGTTIKVIDLRYRNPVLK